MRCRGRSLAGELPSSMNEWETNVATLRRITTEKRAMVIANLQQSFGLSQARMKEVVPGGLQVRKARLEGGS